MNKVVFIFLISISLLTLNRWDQTQSFNKFKQDHSQKVTLLLDIQKKLDREFKDRKLVSLTMSYFFGEVQKLDKEVKLHHRILGLSHLFTPSGIHLSSLLLLLFPFTWLLIKEERRVNARKKIILIICFLVFFYQVSIHLKDLPFYG